MGRDWGGVILASSDVSVEPILEVLHGYGRDRGVAELVLSYAAPHRLGPKLRPVTLLSLWSSAWQAVLLGDVARHLAAKTGSNAVAVQIADHSSSGGFLLYSPSGLVAGLLLADMEVEFVKDCALPPRDELDYGLPATWGIQRLLGLERTDEELGLGEPEDAERLRIDPTKPLLATRSGPKPDTDCCFLLDDGAEREASDPIRFPPGRQERKDCRDALKKAKADEKAGKTVRAYDTYLRLAASYPELPEAEKAKAAARALEKSDLSLPRRIRESQADLLLWGAKGEHKQGRVREATLLLEKLLAQFPETVQATEATKLLGALRDRPASG